MKSARSSNNSNSDRSGSGQCEAQAERTISEAAKPRETGFEPYLGSHTLVSNFESHFVDSIWPQRNRAGIHNIPRVLRLLRFSSV